MTRIRIHTADQTLELESIALTAQLHVQHCYQTNHPLKRLNFKLSLHLLILVVKQKLITVQAKNPLEKRQQKEVSVLDVAGKTQKIVPGKTHPINRG